MPLESATYISDLVATNPLGSDDVALGDDHIRLIKSVLKTTFPNIKGVVSLTQDAINAAIISGTWDGVIPISQLVYDTNLKTLGYLASDGTWRHVQEMGDYQPAGSYQAAGNYVGFDPTGISKGIVSIAMDQSGYPSVLDGNGQWHLLGTLDAVNGKVSKIGDTMSGTLFISGNTGGFVAQYAPTTANTGDFINYPGFTSAADGRGGEFHMQVQEHVGTKFAGLFSLRGSSGAWRYMSIPEGSPINDSQFGDVAYANDLAAYQKAGDYALSSQIDSGSFDGGGGWLRVGGQMTQGFIVNVPANGSNTHVITFPKAFSGIPGVSFNLNDTSQSCSISLSGTNAVTATTVSVSASLHGNSTAGYSGPFTLSVTAVGPVST